MRCGRRRSRAARSRCRFGIQASGTIVQKVQQKTSPNVDWRAEGTDPRQGVIYTAHYDHLGMRELRAGAAADADRIFNGALDNASGLAGTLEVAQALARARTRPLRSIYILFTTAEESGLLGSEYFASAPGAASRRVGGEHQHRRAQLVRPRRDIVLLGAERSTLGEMAAELAAERSRVVGTGSGARPRVFLPIGSFPAGQDWRSRRCRSASPSSTSGRIPAAKKMRDEYNEKDYHQPSDEIQDRLGLHGRRRGHAAARGARMAHRQRGRDAGLSRGRAVRAPACDGNPVTATLVTLDEIEAAAERIRGIAVRTPVLDAGAAAADRISPEVREPAADGRLQDSRRLQHARAARRRGARGRRHHVLVRQSRSGGCHRRARLGIRASS